MRFQERAFPESNYSWTRDEPGLGRKQFLLFSDDGSGREFFNTIGAFPKSAGVEGASGEERITDTREPLSCTFCGPFVFGEKRLGMRQGPSHLKAFCGPTTDRNAATWRGEDSSMQAETQC